MNTIAPSRIITDRQTLAVSPALHKRAMDALKAPQIRNPFRHLVLTPPAPGTLPLLSEAQIRERIRALGMPAQKIGMKARFKVFVLDAATKRVLREDPWRPNLILDQGMNNYGSSIYGAQWGAACAGGTGSTPTVRDSTGTAQITTAGTAVSADNPFFEAGDVGRLLKLDSGGEAYITAFTDTQNVTVGTSLGATGPQDAAVWYVNQTGLATEVKRTTTYLTGSGNTGSSTASNTRTYKWTYDFSAEVAPVNYTELGWSNTGSAGNNLNSRALVSGGSVAVGTGQQLRVVYEIDFTIATNTSTAVTTTITGWPVAPAATQDGDMIFNRAFFSNAGFADLDTNGSPNVNGGCEPSRNVGEMLLCTGTTLPTFGNDYSVGTTAQSNTCSSNAYVSGTFTRSRTATWNLTTGNSTGWRGLTMGNNHYFALVWDEAQTKANTHTLSITWPMTWSRTLTNP